MLNWLKRIIARYGERKVEAALGVAFTSGLFVAACTSVIARALGCFS